MSQRRCPIIELNRAEVETLIRPAVSGRVVDIELMTSGAINSNYKVSLDSGKNILLRLYAHDKEPSACRNELDVIALVADTVPAARVIYAGSSSDIADEIRPYAILEWCEGILLQQLLNGGRYLSSNAYLEETMVAVGETLAAIGFYQFDHSGFFAPGLKIEDPFGADASGYLRSCLESRLVQERLGADLHRRLEKLIDENAGPLNAYTGQTKAVLVHGDFNAKNILVTERLGRWSLSAVLDWEFAHAGTALFDIGNLLREEEKYPGMADAFLKGYAKKAKHPLPKNWRQLARLVDLNSLLEFLTVPGDRPELMAATMTNIEKTISSFSF